MQKNPPESKFVFRDRENALKYWPFEIIEKE